MKKKAVYLLLILVLAICGWILYMETHYADSTLTPVQMTEEEILAELPELAITDADEALQQAVLAMPQVQQVLEKTKPGTGISRSLEISHSAAQKALNDFLPSDYSEIFELSVMDGTTIYLSVLHGPTQRTIWQFYDGTISKTIGIYRVHGANTPDLKTIYSNDHNGIQKEVFKPLWFSWLVR